MGVCAFTTAIAVGAYAGHVLRAFDLKTVDTRFAIRGSTGQPKDVAVVAIDPKTFSAFNTRHLPGRQWPFARRLHAKVVDHIAAQHPKAIAIDIQFTQPTDVADDHALRR